LNRHGRMALKPRFLEHFRVEFWMVVAAFLLRVGLLMRPHAFDGVDDLSFVNEISNIATSLAEGHGFSSPFPFHGDSGPSAWVPPIYPFLCSVWLRVLGSGTRSLIAILSMNSLFSALTCVPLVRIAERLFNRRVALISGWVFALVPYFARWAVTWYWEITLSTLLMTWLFWYALALREYDSLRGWISFGLLFGVAMLTNPSVMTLVGISILWLLDVHGLKIWRRAALSLLVCFLVISPWLVRNRLVMHKWIFLRSNFGFEFSLGNYHGSAGDCWMGRHPWTSLAEYERYANMGEAAYVNQRAHEGREFVREYPEEFLRLCWYRFRIFWDGSVMRMRPRWQPYWLAWLYPLLTVTTSVGLLVMLFRRSLYAHLLFFVILLYPWPYYLDCVQSRFRHLIDPLMLMITVWVVTETLQSGTKALRLYLHRADQENELT